MTILGPDRHGLVNSLAETVAEHSGNWLESRMSRLAGQFAGVARIQCPESSVDDLVKALQQSGLNIQVVHETSTDSETGRTITVDVMGNDRPGIVRELTTAIVKAGGNVEELTTGLESAPMAGHPMFRAHGIISLAEDTSVEILTEAIEQIGADLTVDLHT